MNNKLQTLREWILSVLTEYPANEARLQLKELDENESNNPLIKLALYILNLELELTTENELKYLKFLLSYPELSDKWIESRNCWITCLQGDFTPKQLKGILIRELSSENDLEESFLKTVRD